ncbi:hypothetical protein LCGC14_0774850 [marine sediment metagenome]|uniref:Uncharacterized protein n=1 Tax=marine sediment metagenome TaxID=412755 RepID=A0A0F9SH85_9ZZZZ
MLNKKKSASYFVIFLIIIISFMFYPISSSILAQFAGKQDRLIESLDPKTNANEITVNTPENKTYAAPMSGYYPSTYGFESDNDGSDPAGWDVFEGAGYVNVKNEMFNHKKVIEMYDNTNANHDELHNSFTPQTYGTVEFWVLSDTAIRTFSTILLDDTATSVWGNGIGWLQVWGGTFRYEDSTGLHDTTKILSDNTWYHVEIAFECTTGSYRGLSQDTWRIVIDGEQFGDFTFSDNVDNVSQVYFATRGADNNYRYYVDAVGYSWDPAYSIDDNAQEGLMLSFETGFTPDWLGFSLDGLTNQTITGNTTLPFPSEGIHNIQVFGNDSLDAKFESVIRYFSVYEINILTPKNETYNTPMSGYYPSTYGFESDNDGSDPAGWDVFEGAGYVNVKNEMFNHKKVIEMYDNTNANHDELHNSFTPQTYGTVEFWVLSDTAIRTFSTILLDDTATSVWGNGIGWLQVWGGTFRYEDSTGLHDTTKILSDNTWYHVEIAFECTTGSYRGLSQDTWRIVIDGEQFGDFTFSDNVDNVSQVYFATRGADNNYRYYVDAVGYSWDPAYSIDDNAQEGLMLSFETGFTPDWLGFSLDGLTNQTITGNTTLPFPSEGIHNIQVFGNDSLGNQYKSGLRYFETNTQPLIEINSPNASAYFGAFAPNYDISIIDSNLDSMWYTLDGGSTNVTFSNVIGAIDQIEWDKLGNGTVSIRFYANDSWGLLGYTEVTIRKDLEIPLITLNSPSSSDIFGVNAPGFNITVNELNLDTMWYTLDGGSTNITFSNVIGAIDQIEWDKLGNGTVTIRFFANDSWGLLGYTEVTLKKDIDIPIIIVNLPSSDKIYGANAPGFNISINEPNLDKIWYTLDGGSTNITFSNVIGTIDQTEWEKIGSGTINIRFYATDTSGLLGYTEKTVEKDIENPIITITSPTFNDELIHPPAYSISIDESNLESIWYTIDNGLTNTTITDTIGIIDEALWNAAQGGAVTISFYTRDVAGNIGYASVIIVKLTPSGGPAIPGFDILIILSIFSAASVFYIKRRFKN